MQIALLVSVSLQHLYLKRQIASWQATKLRSTRISICSQIQICAEQLKMSTKLLSNQQDSRPWERNQQIFSNKRLEMHFFRHESHEAPQQQRLGFVIQLVG